MPRIVKIAFTIPTKNKKEHSRPKPKGWVVDIKISTPILFLLYSLIRAIERFYPFSYRHLMIIKTSPM